MMNKNCEKLKRIIYELERQLEETGGMYESVSFELEKKSFLLINKDVRKNACGG